VALTARAFTVEGLPPCRVAASGKGIRDHSTSTEKTGNRQIITILDGPDNNDPFFLNNSALENQVGNYGAHAGGRLFAASMTKLGFPSIQSQFGSEYGAVIRLGVNIINAVGNECCFNGSLYE